LHDNEYDWLVLRKESRIGEMYDTEIKEAKKLLDRTAAEAILAQQRKVENLDDLRHLQGQANQLLQAGKNDREEIDALQRKIAENEAVNTNYR
jgi:hypothetical protein